MVVDYGMSKEDMKKVTRRGPPEATQVMHIRENLFYSILIIERHFY